MPLPFPQPSNDLSSSLDEGHARRRRSTAWPNLRPHLIYKLKSQSFDQPQEWSGVQPPQTSNHFIHNTANDVLSTTAAYSASSTANSAAHDLIPSSHSFIFTNGTLNKFGSSGQSVSIFALVPPVVFS
uniref:Uncharacterized protein n=1 Tax=Ditylenchus dipsaci TaxID=166011 RepID=A0A915DWM9_9BILA